MSPRLPLLNEPMKAFHQEHDPPYIGDVRPTIDLPAGFDLNTLTDFEVWDGWKWIKPDAVVTLGGPDAQSNRS